MNFVINLIITVMLAFGVLMCGMFIAYQIWKRWADKQPKSPVTMKDYLGKDYPTKRK